MSQNLDRPSRPTNSLSLVPVDNGGNTSNSSDNQHSADCNQSVQEFRQPQNLQDLLKISTRLQSHSNEGPREPLTAEKAEFLKSALTDMTVGMVPEMQKRLEILKEIQEKNKNVVDANLNKYEDALEQLVEFLYEIDLAQIFYQINGLNVVAPLLRSEHASLRSLTATIILECCKNNPFCQELSVTDEIFGPLMEMALSDPNKDAMFKAIAAVSAIIRYNPAGIRQFNKYNGIQMVEKALNSGCEKIVNKTIFLVMALCDTDETLKSNLAESGIIVNLIVLMRLSNFIVTEYILRALLSITKDNLKAREICRQHNLQTYLKSLCHLPVTNGDPDRQDMEECAKQLLEQL